MAEPAAPQADPVSADLYADVKHFYARHMQLLDDGKVEEWAALFAEDGLYAAHAHPTPAKGRAEIAARMRKTRAALVREGTSRRHWVGMNVISRDGDVLRVRSYALVIDLPRDAAPFIRASTVCEDVLVPGGDSWLVRERNVLGDTAASLNR